MRLPPVVVALSVVAGAAGLSGCGDPSPGMSTAPAMSATAEPAPGAPGAPGAAGARGTGRDAHFGPGCGAVPASGPGSFEGMASDPVVTAASHNPVLSRLADAVRKANLVDTLNNAQNITLFAPANSAFEQLPAATIDRMTADPATLARTLTYHAVNRRVAPSELSAGNFASLEGATVSTSGSGQDFKINGNTGVVCGNIQTANATVYIIDAILKPPAG
ncbi:MAG TPA: fasciclin domain-containing protein [Pseudonocardia sp.]|jgi:uncharacterized surface protein with fasciclin (FAS1) repeats|nr:fasciclin domain-containing protein [Pseudonocardia sp.]